MIIVRRFETTDAQAVSALIAKTLRITNSKDYSSEELERLIGHLTPEKLIERAGWTHFYVLCDGEKIVGCGAIGPYWGSATESCLFNIFVHPTCQGKGIGRKIIETLEADEFALRASRIEIPASITGCQFYRKLGYDYKNGIKALDAEQHYPLEKFTDPE